MIRQRTDPAYQAEHLAGLRGCYPPEYAVFSVVSRTHPALRSMVRRQRLDELAEDAQPGTPFIPSGGVPSWTWTAAWPVGFGTRRQTPTTS